MVNEDRASRLLAVARRVAESIDHEGLVGVVLFGSLARGCVDEESDVDLAVVIEDGEQGMEEVYVEGIRVEVWKYRVEHFRHTFEDGGYRGRRDSWFLASLWVRLLREGVVLRDPLGLLESWKRQALAWKWTKEEIAAVVRRAEDCLRTAIDAYNEGLVFRGVVAVRDSCYNLAMAWIMSRGGVPSIRPKDIYREVALTGLRELFREVQGLTDLSRVRVKELLGELRRLLDEVWKEPRGARTEYENAVKSLHRGRLGEAVLNARYSAFYLGLRMARRRGVRVPLRLYDAKYHLKILDELEGERRFMALYRELQETMRLDSEYLGGL